jgi:hypothetical protein
MSPVESKVPTAKRVVMTCYIIAIVSFLGAERSSAVEPKKKCHYSPLYIVVERETGGVGTDFIIKKNGSKRGASCDLVIGGSDFELSNEDAEYFMAIHGHLLILDSGTGPDPRRFIVWDLRSQKKVFSGAYSGPYIVENGVIKYWLETDEATEHNCPSFKLNLAIGLSSAMETRG